MSFRRIMSAVLVACMAFCTAACAGGAASGQAVEAAAYSPENPVTITVWNYYNGQQQISFDALVSNFNDTVGFEKGIFVNAVNQSNINNLSQELTNAVDGKVGAQDVPDLAAVYSGPAYELNARGLIADIGKYFTEEELAQYVPSFIEEGRVANDAQLLSFPVSKSTELFVCNITDWADFEAATGVSLDSINTLEALTSAAGKYYNWTDSLTPQTPNDGKALYGRDAMDNYIIAGAHQLGHPVYSVAADGTASVSLDRETFKTLWDNYYIPMIKGWFGEYGSYRSDDAKIGKILALTGSSAGYCMLKSDETHQQAAAEFLKWFTAVQQNLSFSLESGYSPVTTAANKPAAIDSAAAAANSKITPQHQNVLDALLISAQEFTADKGFAAKPFERSQDIRSMLEDSLSKITADDTAAVRAALDAGSTLADATAKYTTDEYFDAWFDDVTNQAKEIMAG
ncbi:MAG: extracellular solute-binding protein [Clostridia bacterium]|nr:extracellular solute-binding protein [Clostridia bacterium]NLS85486.1 extracellular solute-binding protein [Oscillospiraceae bacterium]